MMEQKAHTLCKQKKINKKKSDAEQNTSKNLNAKINTLKFPNVKHCLLFTSNL